MVDQKTTRTGNEKKVETVKVYRAKINEGLEMVCNAVLALLDKFLMRSRTFHVAVTQLDSLNEDFCKDCMLVLRLLRDNIPLRRGNRQDEETGGYGAGASVLTPTLPHHNH
ncbi:unnamed protein product [Rangifer tarandus platyrhynchus]|uniref:Uncharacterized protein n=2 Tax=Rangifer tarandus platyrhynchus TaxID=3082113 RepID=A0ACB0FAC8_RANTA|nr:unnamed protein product [Rangifer tarandus platyrhynchus]CAI9710015.1 unnamed protein product [Rangifer tarandus platyrhynchus]